MCGNGLFVVQSSFSGDHFVGVCVNHLERQLYLINVYSPCNMAGKIRMWEDLRKLKGELKDGEWCVGGDFNVVVSRSERNQAERREFEIFIEDMQLIDVPSSRKKYTCFSSEGFISSWNISAQWIGGRDISDHCPMWLVSTNLSWGPKSFLFNNCWLEHKEFMRFVKECWNTFKVEGRASHIAKEKLKMLQEKLKWWNREVFSFKGLHIESLVKDMNEPEKMAVEEGPPNIDQRKH